MVRTRIASMVLFVFIGPMQIWAEEAKVADKEGFRVYTISLRCGSRNLVGVYESPAEAIRVATETRAKKFAGVEVTTGSEGKLVPTGRPMLYEVYMRTCKSGWRKQGLFADEKKAEATVKALQTYPDRVEIVRDYAPKEVYHIYGVDGGRVRRGLELLSSHRTLEEAFWGAEVLRKSKNPEFHVTSGTKGDPFLRDSRPTQYEVYVQGCKGSWERIATKSDQKDALEVVEAQKK